MYAFTLTLHLKYKHCNHIGIVLRNPPISLHFFCLQETSVTFNYQATLKQRLKNCFLQIIFCCSKTMERIKKIKPYMSRIKMSIIKIIPKTFCDDTHVGISWHQLFFCEKDSFTHAKVSVNVQRQAIIETSGM